MRLKEKTIKELQDIIKREYGQEITEEDAQKLGGSLLRLTKLALTSQARAIERAKKQKS